MAHPMGMMPVAPPPPQHPSKQTPTLLPHMQPPLPNLATPPPPLRHMGAPPVGVNMSVPPGAPLPGVIPTLPNGDERDGKTFGKLILSFEL